MTVPLEFDVAQFSGTAPVFPLSGTVLFPQMTLPLHIFEPRYRKMVADALEGEQLIAMAYLAPGWELDYEGRPEIHEMTCLGRILVHQKLPGGKYNLLLQGMMRAVVVDELPATEPYRVARFEMYRDFYPRESVIDRDHRRRELLLAVRRLFRRSDGDLLIARLLDSEVPLGELCDIIAPMLRTESSARQELLEEVDVDQRSDLLLTELRKELLSAGLESLGTVFPPKFSMN